MRHDELFPPLLSEPQFSQADVLAVAGISAGQLKGLLDRKQVTLRSDHNPGSGRRRLYTGEDILKVVTATEASSIGFPLRWAYLLADRVAQRAHGLVSGRPVELCKHLAMAFYPNKTGDDVAFVPICDGKEASPLPVSIQVIDVDRLINETVAKLEAVIKDEPIPDFSIPAVPDVSDDFSPEKDFYGIWEKDDQGRNVLIGLTFEEMTEMNALAAAKDGDNPRFQELDKKHLNAHARKRFGIVEDDNDDE